LFFVVVLGFELGASNLLGRCSIPATPPVCWGFLNCTHIFVTVKVKIEFKNEFLLGIGGSHL
jgi:hypothetical protein